MDKTSIPDTRAPSGASPTRRTVLAATAAVAAVGAASKITIAQGATAGPIKIGSIKDLSGNLSIYGIQKYHAAMLAVQEINDGKTLAGGPVGMGVLGSNGLYAAKAPTVTINGATLDVVNDGGQATNKGIVVSDSEDILVSSGEKGLLGRQVSLVNADGQSNNTVWQQLARRMIEGEKVDVLFAGFASAEREAIRPIVDRYKQLYFYTNQYEGGVADANTFCTGAVCEQQVVPVVEYMTKKFGPKIFTIAANYNFGQLTAAWVRSFAPQLGAEVIAEEFPPLSVSEFSSVIAKVQAAKPDWVMTLMVGQNQSNYYPQAAAAGLKLPMASTINMAQGYEHKRFQPPAMANMHNAANYMQEIPTKRNQDFVQRFYKMFPKDPYLGQMAQNEYFSIHLYAKAARLAGTTDQQTVRKVLEAGWAIEAPEGTVFLEPATHHCSHYIRLAVSDEKQEISFAQEWPSIEPWWLQRLGVNLVRTPEYKQYTPAEDPYFKMFAQKKKA
jgi:branched-chain amino acid transport system substrate-binding protein